MAEDLTISGGDFDFNDVVFDAVTVNGATVVTLQAAGGTMPLYIEDNEVHELFGVSQSTMVNTYDKQAKAPVIFRLKNRHQMAEFRQMHILANYNYRIFSFSLSAGSSSIYI